MGELLTSDHISLWDALPKEIESMVHSPGDPMQDFNEDDIENLRSAFSMWVRAIYRAPAEILLYDQGDREIVTTLLESDAQKIFDRSFANASLLEPPILAWINRGDYFDALLRNRRPFLYRQKLQIIEAAWKLEIRKLTPPREAPPSRVVVAFLVKHGNNYSRPSIKQTYFPTMKASEFEADWIEASKKSGGFKRGRKPSIKPNLPLVGEENP